MSVARALMQTPRSTISQVLLPAALALLFVAGPSQAEPHDWDNLPPGGGIVLDQQPTQGGGLGSDTAFRNDFGNPTWQQVADDVMLDSSATIRRLTWWGFYHEDNPPATESMRLRFYDVRPADGLPGNILFEESFLNPSRTATGLVIFTGVDPHEYKYEVNLTTPFDLLAEIPYWLEIVQLGDPDIAFRWESGFASPEDQIAFSNPYVPDWMLTTSGLLNNAFQLSTIPKPSTLALFGLGLLLAGKRRSRREAKC
jgi:hypothetical protein